MRKNIRDEQHISKYDSATLFDKVRRQGLINTIKQGLLPPPCLLCRTATTEGCVEFLHKRVLWTSARCNDPRHLRAREQTASRDMSRVLGSDVHSSSIPSSESVSASASAGMAGPRTRGQVAPALAQFAPSLYNSGSTSFDSRSLCRQ